MDIGTGGICFSCPLSWCCRAVLTLSPLGPASVVVWDSQVKEGYRRSQGPADEHEGSKDTPRPAPLAWDGNKSSSVVEELLKNSADKAYGAQGENTDQGSRLA